MKIGEKITLLGDGTVCVAVDKFQAKQTRGWWADRSGPDAVPMTPPVSYLAMWRVDDEHTSNNDKTEFGRYLCLCPIDELDDQPSAAPSRGLPTDDKARKGLPVFRGPLMYFPDAILAVAAVCKAGNDQHNPGQPLHWAREKSTEQMDTALRHMMDHGLGTKVDTDGTYHLAKAAWRILAELQLTIEAAQAGGGK